MLTHILFVLWPYVPWCVSIGGFLYLASKVLRTFGDVSPLCELLSIAAYALGTPLVFVALAVQHDWILAGFLAGTGVLAFVTLACAILSRFPPSRQTGRNVVTAITLAFACFGLAESPGIDSPRLLEIIAVGAFASGLRLRGRPRLEYPCLMFAHAAVGALMWFDGYFVLFTSQVFSFCLDAYSSWLAEHSSADKK